MDPEGLERRPAGLPWTDPLVAADPSGEWELAASFPAGVPVAIEVRADGYAPALAPRIVSALEPETCVLELVRSTRVTGTVVDASNGAPVEGARVEASTRPLATREHPQVRTDAAGRFELLDLPSGPTTLLVEHIAFAPARDGPFQLSGAAERSIALDHGATVTGRLLDAGGNPRAAEDVTLSRVDARSSFHWTTRTNAEGRFVISNLLPGEYRLAWKRWEVAGDLGGSRSSVTLSSLGYTEHLPTASRIVSLDLVDALTLTEHETVEVLLQPHGRASLEGVLLAAVALPDHVAVALVRLGEDGQPLAEARGTFAERGVFRFDHLAAGAYELCAEVTLREGLTLSSRARVEVPAEGRAAASLELVAAR
jgi:hypothetical protein